jgi:sugar O-acyltransferase (sialic acid O-acetyltransferase NeuD family)
LQNYIIIGTGGHGRTVLGYLLRSGVSKKQIEFIDMFQKRNNDLNGCPIIGDLKNGFDSKFDKAGMVVAYGGNAYSGNKQREQASKDSQKMHGKNYYFVSIADPSAIIVENANIALNTTIGIDTIIGPNAVVQEGAIINNRATIEHDVFIESYSCISPGAIVLGGTTLGKRVFVGAGAIIRDDVSIGSDAVIAMGAVVTESVDGSVLVAGNPARIIRAL